MKGVLQFVHEVRIELSKVIWPKWDEFIGSTIVVLLLMVAFAIYLGAVDLMITRLFKYIFAAAGQFFGSSYGL
jgi:preprotein translocase subunit SecE